MVVSESEDTLTQINTALNKSMVLMENNGRLSGKVETKERKSRKSITINTTAMGATSTPCASKKTVCKSILKRNESKESAKSLDSASPSMSTTTSELLEREGHGDDCNNDAIKILDRPHNLDELKESEQLSLDPSEQTYTISDVGPEDELWIVDIPKSINPHDLKGQSLQLNNTTKMKVGKEKYQATAHESSDCLTFVLGTGKEVKPFKILNLRPSGTITFRRRLTSAAKATQESQDVMQQPNVPHFPKGLKLRDPVFGVLPQSRKIRKSQKLKYRLRQSSQDN